MDPNRVQGFPPLVSQVSYGIRSTHLRLCVTFSLQRALPALPVKFYLPRSWRDRQTLTYHTVPYLPPLLSSPGRPSVRQSTGSRGGGDGGDDGLHACLHCRRTCTYCMYIYLSICLFPISPTYLPTPTVPRLHVCPQDEYASMMTYMTSQIDIQPLCVWPRDGSVQRDRAHFCVDRLKKKVAFALPVYLPVCLGRCWSPHLWRRLEKGGRSGS
ncbi:hypothetical protein F4777DRAFT_193959 [Nemania sp. FL0916]|nr:hypothetical protein F4777DRAFT_193959 [Nemania sp. FL0916]